MKFKKWMVIFIICVCIYGSMHGASFVISLAKEPKVFNEWISSYGMFAQLIMILLIFVQVVFAWIPGEIFEVVAGYVFGFWQGSLLVLLGSLCASACIVSIVKRYGDCIVRIFFSKDKLNDTPFLKNSERLHTWIALAFLIPGSPKDLLTYAIGLTNMKVSHFLWISTFARIPSIITSTLTGSALGIENYTLALGSFLFTIVVSALGIYVYRCISHTKQIQIDGNLQK